MMLEFIPMLLQKNPLYQKNMHQLVLVGVKNIKKKQLMIGHKLFSQMNQVLRLESSHGK